MLPQHSDCHCGRMVWRHIYRLPDLPGNHAGWSAGGMTGKGSRDEQYRTVLVNHWVAKARDDLGSAQVNLQSGRLSNAVRDIYFACFHVVSAFFMNEGKAFKKHSQVRASFHRELIRTGRIDVSW